MAERTLMQDFEVYLERRLDGLPSSRTRDAMRYSLEAGGKRVRPQLLFSALESYGLDPRQGFAMAAAIEMIHTYSLIHDDMPEMDNDDLRRGRPACHVAFGADVALLAGDALQSLAFETLLAGYPDRLAAPLALLLARKAGAAGMCYGQDLDLGADGSASLEDLERIETYKTGCLIQLPLEAAALIAGRGGDLPAWNALGKALGIQFQLQDDLLDLQADEQTMGKSLSDARNDKASATALMSVDEVQAAIDACSRDILEALERLQIESAPMLEITDRLKNRTH